MTSQQLELKQIDDYTVQYTLNQPESFWNSKVTTSDYAPINEEFLNSQGKDYGAATPQVFSIMDHIF